MRKVALALCLAAAALAGATQVYTSEAAFLPNIQAGYYLEDFSNFTYGNPLNGTQLDWDAPGNGNFNFHAFAASGLWSNQSALSTNTAFDPLVITFGNSPHQVSALGGHFTSTDINGNPIPFPITISLSDGTSQTIQGGDGFLGFTAGSGVFFTSLTANCPNQGTNAWPQIDHFFVGQTPEPASLLLLVAGLLIRRR